jgi:hypothetical protein
MCVKKARKSLLHKKKQDLKLPDGLPGVGQPITVSLMPDNVLGITTIDLGEMKALGIVLRGGRGKVETHETLLHEIMHAVETEARRQGVLKAALPEEVIEFFAGGLLILLGGSGLYAPVSPKEVMAYVDRVNKERSKRSSATAGWSGELEPEP